MSELEFPMWFDEVLKLLECPQCHSPIKKGNIVAQGIRKSPKGNKSDADDSSTSYFIEHHCPKCKQAAVLYIVEKSMQEFVAEMSDVYSGIAASAKDDVKDEKDGKDEPKKEVKPAPPKKSKISDDEFLEVKQLLKNCSTHHEFLINIGMTQEQLDELEKEYAQKDNKAK